jgi:hypothetical protein
MKFDKPTITKVKSLWLAKRTDEVGYDEYDSCIVAAANEDIARAQASTMWASSSTFTCKVIGTTETEPTGIVHSSFCAG